MISAKRMVAIFRRRGGGEFADLSESLTADEIAYIEKVAGGEPIVAMMPSKDEWFALTGSHFVLSRDRELRTVRLDNINAVAISRRYRKDLRKFEHIKITGADLDVDLQDRTTFQVRVEPGGPYIGLMNVLMRIATINRRGSVRKTSANRSLPTTNDRRPTTQL